MAWKTTLNNIETFPPHHHINLRGPVQFNPDPRQVVSKHWLLIHSQVRAKPWSLCQGRRISWNSQNNAHMTILFIYLQFAYNNNENINVYFVQFSRTSNSWDLMLKSVKIWPYFNYHAPGLGQQTHLFLYWMRSHSYLQSSNYYPMLQPWALTWAMSAFNLLYSQNRIRGKSKEWENQWLQSKMGRTPSPRVDALWWSRAFMTCGMVDE